MFGVSERTAARWLTEGAPPKQAEGYNVGEWYAWRHGERAESGEQESASQAKARLVRAQADKAEIELARIRGTMVPRDQVDRDQVQTVRFFVGVIERAGAELATMLLGKTTAAAIKSTVDGYFLRIRRDIAGAAKRRPQ